MFNLGHGYDRDGNRLYASNVTQPATGGRSALYRLVARLQLRQPEPADAGRQGADRVGQRVDPVVLADGYGPVLVKNLRLKKFQATYAMYRYGSSYQRTWFVFNATDRDNYDLMSFTADTGTGNGPELYSVYNGQIGGHGGTEARIPACPADGDLLWCRVESDGSTVTGKCLVTTGSTPSEADWTGATLVGTCSSYRNGGGQIGFTSSDGGEGVAIQHLTIKSYNPATSSFDTTEANDEFALDGSGYANDALASDSNGNQTYDGSQVYTYDAWNRLMTISHGYRDSSANLHHGQASVTCAYDAKGRRITKAVSNTGFMDCTYHYYYKGDQQIEQRNGSVQTIKQFVWGHGRSSEFPNG